MTRAGRFVKWEEAEGRRPSALEFAKRIGERRHGKARGGLSRGAVRPEGCQAEAWLERLLHGPLLLLAVLFSRNGFRVAHCRRVWYIGVI